MKQTIYVLAIDAVNRFPLNIDKPRIADNYTVICKLQIDRRFLGEVATHSRLSIFSRAIDKIKTRQKVWEGRYGCFSFGTFEAKVVKD